MTPSSALPPSGRPPTPEPAGSGAVAAQEVAFRARRVLDIRSGRAIADGVVVCRGDRIEQVGGPVPADAELVDLGDRTLLPGLIDTHTHFLLQGNRTRAAYAHQILREEPAHRVVRAVRSLGIALGHGFTTLRDLGTEGCGFADVAIRDAVAEGVVPGPRLLVAGPAIGRTGTYPLLGYRSDWRFPVGVAECEGADGCRSEVRREVARGVDWIKVYATQGRGLHLTDDGYLDAPPPWTQAELDALVDEAHRQGLRVAAHASEATGTEMAVAAGADSIEHGYSIRPATARAMAERGTVLVPTLLVAREVSGNRAAERGAPWTQVPEIHRRSVENCRQAGVPIVCGTDVGGFEWEDVNQVEELGILVELGWSPLEAIQSATLLAARLLQREGQLGELAVGAAADLAACPGDPLRDIGRLLDIDVVVRAGRVVVAPPDGLHPIPEA